MPFDIKGVVAEKRKVINFEFSLAFPKKYDASRDYENIIIELSVVFRFDDSKTACFSRSYNIGSFFWKTTSGRSEFVNDLAGIFILAKAEEGADFYFAENNYSKILIVRQKTAYSPIKINLRHPIPTKDPVGSAFLVIDYETGYFLNNEDIMALGEWLYKKSKSSKKRG